MAQFVEQYKLRNPDAKQAARGETSIKRRLVELQEQEHLLAERGRMLHDRERRLVSREASLLASPPPNEAEARLEMNGLKTAAELVRLAPEASLQRREASEVTLGHGEVTNLPEEQTMMQAAADDVYVQPFMSPQFPHDGPLKWSDDDVSDLNDVGGGTNMDPQAMNEAALVLDARRREIKRERAALEEMRRQWKADLQRARSLGSSAQAQAMLQEVRATLDDRAQALNRLMEEQRTFERALASQRRVPEGLRGYTPASPSKYSRADPLAATTPRAHSGLSPSPNAYSSTAQEDADLMRRWQQLLSTPAEPAAAGGMPSRYGFSPSGRGVTGRSSPAPGTRVRPTSSGPRTAREHSQLTPESLAHRMRSMGRDLGGRALSARGTRSPGYV